jgi:hypothetical protein
MTYLQYAAYVTRRVLESLVIAACAGACIHIAQQNGWWEPMLHTWLRSAYQHLADWFSFLPGKIGPWWNALNWWSWPALAGLLGHLVFGPKQERPIYLKKKGILYSYGGVDVDHNAGCRGGLSLGKTGAGKTQVCINPRNHSILINNPGVEKPAWRGSEAAKQFDAYREEFTAAFKKVEGEINDLVAERTQLARKIEPIQDRLISAMLVLVRSTNKQDFHATFSADVLNEFPNQKLMLKFKEESHAITQDELLGFFKWISLTQRSSKLTSLPMFKGEIGKTVAQYTELLSEDAAIDAEINVLYYLLQVKRADLQRFADTIKPLRFSVPPVGMVIFGAKGNEWQNAVPMLHHYRRDEDLCLLQTRPVGAPPDWKPPAKFNLIGYEQFPADTFAKLLCDTSAAVTGNTEQDFFAVQARDGIANGIRLMRAIRDAQAMKGIPKDKRVIPNLALLARILSALPIYNDWMTEIGAAPSEKEVEEMVRDERGQRVPQRVKRRIPASLASDDLRSAREKLEKTYWGLPDETRGGVMGNIRNVIGPFTEPEVAEVFCDESTFDIGEICYGKVICLAMPQLFAVQRMYVATIIKTLTFQIGMNIFDLRKDNPAFSNRNVVLIDSDEHQVSAGQEDQQVDRTREAQFTLYAATQTRSALYMRYGGKEKAIPVLSNLANVFICTSGNDDCAEESVKVIGEATQIEKSYSGSGGGRGSSTSISYKEKPFFTKGALKMLPPFHVIFVPAEGKYIYRFMIVMPVTPDGKTPAWWFGSWNPWAWLYTLGLPLPRAMKPRNTIPPWKARAPLKAQLRYLLGFDGTWIILKDLPRKKAMKMAMRDS